MHLQTSVTTPTRSIDNELISAIGTNVRSTSKTPLIYKRSITTRTGMHKLILSHTTGTIFIRHPLLFTFDSTKDRSRGDCCNNKAAPFHMYCTQQCRPTFDTPPRIQPDLQVSWDPITHTLHHDNAHECSTTETDCSSPLIYYFCVNYN